MSKRSESKNSTTLSLELFQPTPDVLYSLDMAEHLSGVSRHSILVYCNAGLVRPVLQPPHGIMTFTEEAIYAIRRIEYYRNLRQSELSRLKLVFDLLDEVQRLRAELRFYAIIRQMSRTRTLFGSKIYVYLSRICVINAS